MGDQAREFFIESEMMRLKIELNSNYGSDPNSIYKRYSELKRELRELHKQNDECFPFEDNTW